MKEHTENKFLYLFSSLLIYIFLYVLISLLLKDFYKPIIGVVSFMFVALFDLYFYHKRVRIYIRIIILVLFYFLIRFLLDILTNFASTKDSYNIFVKTKTEQNCLLYFNSIIDFFILSCS